MPAELAPHILIVEDDEAMLELIERFLHRQRYATTAATDASTALAAATEHAPSMAIIDYMLPGEMNGLELLTVLRNRFPSIPTLFISAFGSPELCRTARNSGATDCLIKPFDMAILMTRVDTLLTHNHDE
ncbi:MAG: response regulator [Nitrospirota bacterium]|jgi:DNA-binding response OmpR family regulator